MPNHLTELESWWAAEVKGGDKRCHSLPVHVRKDALRRLADTAIC
jgi:hypothetical protein